MKRRLARAGVLCGAVVVILAMTALPAGAIIDGQQDTENIYSNVGMLQTRIQLDEDFFLWIPHGSGTLVKNDAGGVIFLTAAHCVDWLVFDGLGLENTYVSFEPMTELPWTDVVEQGMSAPTYHVERVEIHPAYLEALASIPYRGNSKMLGIGPGREDVALLWLDTQVPGVEPAGIVSRGGLDALDLKSETFTVVGYGLNGFVTGNLKSRGSVAPDSLWSGRNYREVSVVTEHDAFGDRYLKLTEANASHDSGGPTFHDGVIAAINVWGDSMRFEGHSYQYRLDTELAQDFLDEYLDLGD